MGRPATRDRGLDSQLHLHAADPDSCAYYRHEDRSFIGPGAQFIPGQQQAPQRPAGGSEDPSGGGPGTSAGPLGSGGGSGASGAAAHGSSPGYVAVPGTFRPSRMSETALAMRCVCRLWCEVLSEGVRRVSHLALGNCADVMVRNQDPPAVLSPRRGGAGGACQAGPGPSSEAAAAAASGAPRRRSPRTAAASGRPRAAARARGAGNSTGSGVGSFAASSSGALKARSLGGLSWLRNLQVLDTAVHLDLAASCPWLEELVVWTQNPHQQYGTHPGRDSAGYLGPTHGPHPTVGSVVSAAAAGGGRRGGAAAGGTRRSALDRTLSSLPGLRRLRLSGVDASAARLGSAIMGLTALTSLRLFQCKLPTFIGAPERARSGQSNFARELVLNLGAKLQDLSLQGCCIRAVPDEVLAGLTSLRMLDLSSNWLRELPTTLTLLQRLEYLDVQHNTLVALPEGMAALTRLADLDLSENYLRRLPADFGQLTALTHLHLGGLHGLDMVLCWPLLTSLTNLHALGLGSLVAARRESIRTLGEGEGSSGPLHALVSALAPAGRLRELMLDGCGLDGLPACFSGLTALSHLSLMENFDTSGFPNAITGLRGLAVLRLGYLDLSAPLPAGLYDLGFLRELDLEQNFLPYVSSDISKLSNLQHALPWTALYRLTRLRQLSLSGPEEPPRVTRGIGALTGLEALQMHAVSLPGPVLSELCNQLTGLSSLDLASCQMKALPAAITKLARLADLQLTSNQLEKLPAGFGALSRLTDLGLSGNRQLRSLPADITCLTRLRSLSWTVDRTRTKPPSEEQLSWMAQLQELALHGEHSFAELAKLHGITWPKRTSYW
ncbi:hypothetical protein VOLCADRAFT_103962 [Volvox carteri f. nagariensis]|uniref:Disease resistance R13L4/SHOC-2-like LRR domain-containing protein n=1 Tax=Volvox carteri f. nagariensis TaxID=3068 RepID=D8TQC7_VOLCA|nr:uncharacterized protein VOLCADRAFT_103962 [Volvox carteri f. nagariensis]EFJ50511.1 hypothetical protein VOLCADRAFT_103962 [Volvox carteri f. nagariensis]|eukprot:XP_002948636.1 hypothetical protein VOLCADRAFT_103962 [Volvox carteri f. nagariensis]